MNPVDTYRAFFLQPTLSRHRRYEVLRARVVERGSIRQIADRFGLSPQTVDSQIRDFKRDMERDEGPAFFVELPRGPKTDRKKPKVREHILRLWARGYANTDIHAALAKAGMPVSVSLIDQVLREEGRVGLRKRNREERERVRAELASGTIPGLTAPPPACPETPAVADLRQLDLAEGRSLYSRVAGVFLLVPFLLEAGFDAVVSRAQLAGTKMIPPLSYVLSLLALKLPDKERKSHISDTPRKR